MANLSRSTTINWLFFSGAGLKVRKCLRPSDSGRSDLRIAPSCAQDSGNVVDRGTAGSREDGRLRTVALGSAELRRAGGCGAG